MKNPIRTPPPRHREVYEVDVRAPDGREHELAIDVLDGRVLAEVIDVDDDD